MQRWLRKNAKRGEIATLVRYAVAKLMAEEVLQALNTKQ